MHKGMEENCVSTVNQVFLIKSVIVLLFINNQHLEISHNLTHFPKLFLLDIEYKIRCMSHSESR